MAVINRGDINPELRKKDSETEAFHQYPRPHPCRVRLHGAAFACFASLQASRFPTMKSVGKREWASQSLASSLSQNVRPGSFTRIVLT